MTLLINFDFLLLITTSYHFLASVKEKKSLPAPGKIININNYRLHLYSQGQGKPTLIIDHSLGGIDGYFLIEEIAKITNVCIYDRAGYGWSKPSFKPRHSREIVQDLDLFLTKANIEPPFILVGDSFGTYNVRLYAHQFPEKVVGIVLTDGLHEAEMLDMPPLITILKIFFLSGFIMATIGSCLGIIRLLGNLKLFELIKPELSKFDRIILKRVKKSFYSHNHWITMAREIWNLNESARQVSVANDFGDLPIINIKASCFFKRSLFNFFLPLNLVDKLRDRMHERLMKLSTNCHQIQAAKSSHFVWIDEPELIVKAIERLLNCL
jgi:pimeloyl-ACP methyl ester carboxylesterase